jgi:hypothetical protein
VPVLHVAVAALALVEARKVERDDLVRVALAGRGAADEDKLEAGRQLRRREQQRLDLEAVGQPDRLPVVAVVERVRVLVDVFFERVADRDENGAWGASSVRV